MIVKAHYTTTATSAKAWILTMTNQAYPEGTHDQLFDWLGGMSQEEAYQIIDQAKGKGYRYFYHLILSPDPKTEDVRRDLHLRDVTEAVMVDLAKHSRHPLSWAGAVHASHSRYRHIHVLTILARRIDRPGLALLRASGSEECRFQREGLDTGEGKGGSDLS